MQNLFFFKVTNTVPTRVNFIDDYNFTQHSKSIPLVLLSSNSWDNDFFFVDTGSVSFLSAPNASLLNIYAYNVSNTALSVRNLDAVRTGSGLFVA